MGYGLDEKGMKMSRAREMLWIPYQLLKSLALIPSGFGAPARLTMEMTLGARSKRLNQRKSFLPNFGMYPGFCPVFL